MSFLDKFSGHAHWFLRLAFAGVFLYHGIDKAMSIGTDEGAYAMMVGMMGMPAPAFFMVNFAELAAGAGVLIGAFTSALITRLAGLAAAPVMLGAIFMVHAENGWNFMKNGMEFQVVLLLIALYFFVAGNVHSEASKVRDRNA